MRLVIALLLTGAVLTGGCDRSNPGNEQASANAAAPAASAPDASNATEAGTDTIGTIDRANAGTPAPDLAFTAPDGSSVTLARFKGKPLLVNLWATWCAPCVAEMPTLDALAEQSGDALQVLVVSQDMDGSAKVAPFFAQAKFRKLEPYLDPNLGLSVHYRANLPTTILYDSSGKEVWRMLGGMDWTTPTAKALVAEAR